MIEEKVTISKFKATCLSLLKKVKQTRPEVEIIILTGHGADADKDLCMGLGAFAYLQKPIDIDTLSDVIKRAHEKIQGLKR